MTPPRTWGHMDLAPLPPERKNAIIKRIVNLDTLGKEGDFHGEHRWKKNFIK